MTVFKDMLCISFLRYAKFLKFSWGPGSFMLFALGIYLPASPWMDEVCRPELVQIKIRRRPPPSEFHPPYCLKIVIATSQRDNPQLCTDVKKWSVSKVTCDRPSQSLQGSYRGIKDRWHWQREQVQKSSW